jgi:hypothetical protein
MALAIDFGLLMHYISRIGSYGGGMGTSRRETWQRNLPSWRFRDPDRQILFPVRKSLTKKSGFNGLPRCARQDSLFYGGRGFGPGLLSEEPIWFKTWLIRELPADHDNHE